MAQRHPLRSGGQEISVKPEKWFDPLLVGYIRRFHADEQRLHAPGEQYGIFDARGNLLGLAENLPDAWEDIKQNVPRGTRVEYAH